LLNHSDTQNTIYDITNPTYWDKGSLYQEMDRIYDVCVGVPTLFQPMSIFFHLLFNSIDNAGSRKREIAQAESRVGKEVERSDYLDLPEVNMHRMRV